MGVDEFGEAAAGDLLGDVAEGEEADPLVSISNVPGSAAGRTSWMVASASPTVQCRPSSAAARVTPTDGFRTRGG